MKNIERFLDYLKSVRGLSQNTIINYKIDLRDFYKFTEGKKIDLDIIRSYLKKLYEKKVHIQDSIQKNKLNKKLLQLFACRRNNR